MNRQKKWQQKALSILDEYELGLHKEKLTQVKFAELLGVSRQTLWRDEKIRNRFISATERFNSKSKISRRDCEMRMRLLENQLEKLKTENDALIQVIMDAARSLRDSGIDPRLYLSDAAK